MQAASHLVTHQHSPLWLMSEKKKSGTQIGATCFRTTPPEKTHFLLKCLRPRAH